jgi:hypothetical protein
MYELSAFEIRSSRRKKKKKVEEERKFWCLYGSGRRDWSFRGWEIQPHGRSRELLECDHNTPPLLFVVILHVEKASEEEEEVKQTFGQEHQVFETVEDVRVWLVNGSNDGHVALLSKCCQLIDNFVRACTVQSARWLIQEQNT